MTRVILPLEKIDEEKTRGGGYETGQLIIFFHEKNKVGKIEAYNFSRLQYINIETTTHIEEQLSAFFNP